MTYHPRIVDAELEQQLAAAGGVVIEGPKACGKTATARQRAASEVLLDVDKEARRTIAIDAALVLDGATPRLIDEWQLEPDIWNHIRRAVDARVHSGQFILTGSAVPADDVTRHTGAGRLARLQMRPMSLFEAGYSSGALSLAALLDGAPPRSPRAELPVRKVAELVSIGGWPSHLGRSPKSAQQANRHYLAEICRSDIERVDGIRRDPVRVGRLLQSLARNVATQATVSTLARDVGGADNILRENTAHEYLAALGRLMIVEDQPAWAPHLRSKSKLRGTPKRHFVDPSLAVAALRTRPERLLKDLNLLGLLFESMVIRDLRIYAQAAEAEVLQYRDNTGLEVDAIIQAGDGRWAAFEVKLGAARVDEGAANLLKFAERVDLNRCGKPSTLGVIVSDGYGYVRADGISVLPIGALGP